MSTFLTHAEFLRERGRHEEAVTLLHSHLAHHPEDPAAFIELALNRMEIDGQMDKALADAKTATGLIPDAAFPLALQAFILSRIDREKEALQLAEQAIALAPDYAYAWRAKSVALCGLSRWKEAEEAARQALAIHPDDEDASNVLSHALRLQNRLDESEDETKRRLSRNPENAFSFANAGWAALQRGKVKEAEDYFKEALRLNPNMNYARNGLKESYRARSAFYRIFLKWSFFQQRLAEKHRTAIYIGIFVSFKVLRNVLENTQPILLLPLFLIYYVFIFGSWLSTGLANFFLLRDSTARLSLDKAEKIDGAVVGSLFFCGLSLLVPGFIWEKDVLMIAGGALMASAIPASLVFTKSSRIGSIIFGCATILILLLSGFAAWQKYLHPEKPIFEGTGGGILTIAILIAVGITWLPLIPALRKKRE